MLSFDREVDDFSADDHDKDQLFKDVHEVILAARIVDGQADLREVLSLLWKVIIVCNVPAERVAQS